MSILLERSISIDRFRAATSTLNEQKEVITDTSEVLPGFCQSLEVILRQGLKRGGLGALGLADRDYWNCIEGLAKSSKINFRIPPSVSYVISAVQQCQRVGTSLSRGRLFLRIALTKGILVDTIQVLLQNQAYVRYWYKDSSVFVDYQEKGVILEILKALKKKTYKLDVNNCSFLDESWLIPVCQKFDFVPTSTLGLTLFTLEGKCVVIDVQSGSAAEEKDIVPGDCLEELFGVLIDERWSTKIADLKKKHKGKPIIATFVKGRYLDGRWFSPLYRRYKTLCMAGKCSPEIPQEYKENSAPLSDHDAVNLRNIFEITYLGCSDVGPNGSCIFVQDGFKNLAPKDYKKIKLRLQLMERDIVLTHADSNEIFARYSYTETSSCALRDGDHNQFGFIVGNTTCSFADHFFCHVFTCESRIMAKQIIEGIGKGFDRTVYCV